MELEGLSDGMGFRAQGAELGGLRLPPYLWVYCHSLLPLLPLIHKVTGMARRWCNSCSRIWDVLLRGTPSPPLCCPISPRPSACPQDPSWNHRVYRLAVAKLSPPIIPFVPLLLKGASHGSVHAGDRETKPSAHPDPPTPLSAADMTFIHEGNRTLAENLINFEKMVSGGGGLLPSAHPLGALLGPEHPLSISRARRWGWGGVGRARSSFC